MQSLWNRLRDALPGGSFAHPLHAIPLLDDLSARELAVVDRHLHTRTTVAGETLFRQGEPGLGLFIILQGAVSIQKEPGGRELARLSTGDFFGEIALLNETARTATARCVTDCTLAVLYQPDLLALLNRSPRLGAKITLALARIVALRLGNYATEVEQRLAVYAAP
jgi:CRP-like cAMP-binding protein